MQCKQQRHKQARPKAPRPSNQQPAQERSIQRMNQQIDKVRPRRVEMKQRTVDLMRDPRQWMPIRLLKSRERPYDPVPRHALAHMQIVRYVTRIVIIHERMPVNGVI